MSAMDYSVSYSAYGDANAADGPVQPRIVHQAPNEHRRLLRIAREYRQKGYTVVIHPSPADLPPALAKCPFDMVVEGEGKKIAVEVRNKENLKLNGSEDLRRMTTLVEQQPGWEFELVVTNPRRKAS